MDSAEIIKELDELAEMTPPICLWDSPKTVEVGGGEVTVYCKPFEQFQSLVKQAADALREQKQSKAKDNYVLTNADRIRAMTDEELAEVLAVLTKNDVCMNPYLMGCDGCPFSNFCADCVEGSELDWLQQPCGGADHE